jgi:hypothetical protein
MRKFLSLAFACVLLLLPAQGENPKQEKKVLKNADIALMTQNHFDDETLIKIIQVSDTDFDISGDALISLKNQGVSSAVMRAMLQAARNKKRGVTEIASPPAVSGASNSAPAPPPPGSGTSQPSSEPAQNNPQNTTAATMNSPAMPNGMAMGARGAGSMGISPQQMAAMQAQMSAMGGPMAMGMGGTGGMFGGMFNTNYSPEQMPHVFLMLQASKGKQEIASSQAQIGQSRYKGGMGAGGMALRSLTTEGLSFAAMGAGPAGMMAMSAFSMVSGFMPGMRPGAPTMTYVWGLPGRKSARELDDADPMFELNYGDIPGVDPDAYEPALLKLYPTKDNYRLVGATQVKMNAKNMMAGGGPENGKWLSEERWPVRVDKEERGFYIVHVSTALEPGEYAVVLRPTKGYKATPSAFGGGAQVFYSVWDFSVPWIPVEEIGKKKKKK